MLKVYGNQISSPSNKVRYVANYLNLDYDFEEVDLRGGAQRKPEYLAMNPAGKVPVIRDGEFTLFESNAIIRYLARREKSDIYPDELKARALTDQWMDFGSIHVGGAMSRIFWNKVIVHRIGQQPDESSLKTGESWLGNQLPILNTRLGQTAYLAGKTLTLADFCLLATIDPIDICQIDLKPYRALNEWREKLKTQDFYQKCHKYYGEALMENAQE